jgi:hypothetical protein
METIKPKNIRNMQYHLIGAAFIIINYIRYSLFGYKSPRIFSINQFDRVIDHDFRVVEEWMEYLYKYTKEKEPLQNKVILELGPGPDLGIALILDRI